MKQYDLMVLGAGPGGYVAAIRAAQNGLSVAVCEPDAVGGACLNRGCIPTKTLLHSAESYRRICGGAAPGVHTENVRFDLAEIYARKDTVITQLRAGIEQLFRANGIDLIRARAAIAGVGRVLAGGAEYACTNILIATGAQPALPPIPGIVHACTSDRLLAEPTLYPRLTIIGGGVIGMEFASLYAAFGCEVTVIEALDRILPTLDREIGQNLSMQLKRRGVRLFTGARVDAIEPAADGLNCLFTQKEQPLVSAADGVLVAVGRRADTAGLCAPGFTLETERGYIRVDEQFRTAQPGIWAIGDVTGKLQLAHAASAQGIAVADAIAGKPGGMRLDTIPSCVYTDPEIACVGITADEAKEQGITVKTGKHLLSGSGKALIEESDRSFIKAVFDAQSGRLLGVQMMCPRATDLIGEATTAIACGLTGEQLAGVVRPHPTFCEGFTEAVEAAFGTALHTPPKRA